jgi:FkbM family methyltransferase
MARQSVEIMGRLFDVTGDDGYLQGVGNRFEPETVALLALLCDARSQVLDVGANIGMTALALSQICSQGKIVALEPVKRTFEYLQANLFAAGSTNVRALNYAAGARDYITQMQGVPQNLSGSFVADQYDSSRSDHFSTAIEVKRIDSVFPELGLERLDFMKVDTEGFELEVFEGARETLDRFKPIVFFEMNHVCLNTYRRTSVPEFRDRLLAIFPVVYALQFPEFLDFRAKANVHHIYYHHMVRMRYMNVVAAYSADQLLPKLSLLGTYHQLLSERNLAQSRLNSVLNSRSWKLTAPLRRFMSALRRG